MRRIARKLTAVASLVTASLLGAPVPAAPALAEATNSGYLMLSEDGDLYPFGAAPFCGRGHRGYANDVEITPNGLGYWILNYRAVDFKPCEMPSEDRLSYERTNDFELVGDAPVSLSVLPDGTGYWVFTYAGRAIPFGNAQFYGDMSKVILNGGITNSVATPTGKGYWMVAADGGIFAFGDARFHGSTGDLKLNKPVVSMAPDPDGAGYWLVASDGGIFAFDAPFYGSMGGTPLNRPVSGMVPGSKGYLMVAEDGGIFSFGDVAFHGSLGGKPPAAAVKAVALVPQTGSPGRG
jgi:hypothetical protein